MSIKVMLVDDHSVVRSGLAMLINVHDDISVVASAASGEEAFMFAQETRPDVIVMDLTLPGEDGVAATARIKKAIPDVSVLVLTMHEERDCLLRALKAGASGYILKSADDTDVITAIRTVAKGEAFLYPGAAKTIIQELLRNDERDVDDAELTKRENEVIALIAKGFSNKQIAEQLHLSVKTIETHRSNIIEKLNIRSRSELVDYAIRRGLLEIEA